MESTETHEVLDPAIFGPASPCFGCSPTHPFGLKLRCERHGDVVRTRFLPGPHHEGPPGIMHGGLVTALADELAAWTVIGLRRKFGFTGALSCKLHRPVRTGLWIEGTGRIEGGGSRVVRVAIELRQDPEPIAFTGELTFAVLDEAGAERLLGAPLPEEWRRFARREAT